MRADDCFWIGENCTLRENLNELKIIERASGNIIVQIVIDDASKPPNQEISAHFGATKILQKNWDHAWKQLWHRDRTPNHLKATSDKMRFKEINASKEFKKYKDNEAAPTVHELRAQKLEEKVKGLQEEGQKRDGEKAKTKIEISLAFRAKFHQPKTQLTHMISHSGSWAPCVTSGRKCTMR